MDGIIIVNKEKNMTSHDVVNKIRKIFNTKKVGHLGTLDPNATGVLAICIGEATKLVQFLSEHNKTYIAKVCLGKSTDTYDLDGNILDNMLIEQINVEELDDIIASFKGKQLQIPPIYSSVKINGRKLYDYARKNEYIEIPPRVIDIYKIKRISNLVYNNGCYYFDLYVEASKGTYIRSLCFDIGKKLRIPSLMADLCRIKLGDFEISMASTLSDIENGQYQLIKMLDALVDFPIITLESAIKKAKLGMKINFDLVQDLLLEKASKIVIAESDKLIAIYELEENLQYYKAVRVWN